MKIQNNKIKLSKRDVQIGNFVVTTEEEHYKIQAVNQHWSLRVGKQTQIGQLVEQGLKDAEKEGFSRIIAYLYTVSSAIGDGESIKATINAIVGAGKRRSINNEKPVVVFASVEELLETALDALFANNIWLSESELTKITDILRLNFERNKEAYNPSVLEKINDAVIEEEKAKAEEISRLSEQPQEK